VADAPDRDHLRAISRVYGPEAWEIYDRLDGSLDPRGPDTLLADVRYGGKQHLFVAVIETTGTAQLRAFLPEAKKVIASVRVPALSA
jgi:hypothetical protein